MTPQRIQLSRAKGWRKPDGAIVVARPSRWGNKFHVVKVWPGPEYEVRYGRHPVAIDILLDRDAAMRKAIALYRLGLRNWIEDDHDGDAALALAPLRGHDLACWCGPGPCHADVLLELANR